MRLIVIFDLPTQTKKEKKNYIKFRKFLINNGFDMMQYSVYIKICRNREHLQRIEKIIQNNVPLNGHIRSLAITEKQYKDMNIFIGSKTIQEETIIEQQLTIF